MHFQTTGHQLNDYFTPPMGILTEQLVSAMFQQLHSIQQASTKGDKDYMWALKAPHMVFAALVWSDKDCCLTRKQMEESPLPLDINATTGQWWPCVTSSYLHGDARFVICKPLLDSGCRRPWCTHTLRIAIQLPRQPVPTTTTVVIEELDSTSDSDTSSEDDNSESLGPGNQHVGNDVGVESDSKGKNMESRGYEAEHKPENSHQAQAQDRVIEVGQVETSAESLVEQVDDTWAKWVENQNNKSYAGNEQPWSNQCQWSEASSSSWWQEWEASSWWQDHKSGGQHGSNNAVASSAQEGVL
jgi:hypothetical protein